MCSLHRNVEYNYDIKKNALSHGDYIASLPQPSVDLRCDHLEQILMSVMEMLSKIFIICDESLSFSREALDLKKGETQCIFFL